MRLWTSGLRLDLAKVADNAVSFVLKPSTYFFNSRNFAFIKSISPC